MPETRNPFGVGGVFDMLNAPGVNGNPVTPPLTTPQTTTPAANPYATPQPSGGLFKFGGEEAYNPRQPAPKFGAEPAFNPRQPDISFGVEPAYDPRNEGQSPRYRVNNAMMRSPYYNPYFSSFQ